MAQEAFFKICLPGPISHFPPTSPLRASPVASSLCTLGSYGIISDQKNHMYIKKSVAWISNVPSAYVVSSQNLTHSLPGFAEKMEFLNFAYTESCFLNDHPLSSLPHLLVAGINISLWKRYPSSVVLLWAGKGRSQETHWGKEQGIVLPLTCPRAWGMGLLSVNLQGRPLAQRSRLCFSIPMSTFSGNNLSKL